ncbi:MAG: kynureninase [Gammaproteobacteria bacterium]|nr:kynureninase [Gammaproteobacteria bacterium]
MTQLTAWPPRTRADCLALDQADPLAALRRRFALPPRTIYLDGNSLGALPRDTPAHLAAVVREQWGRGLIRSWPAAGWIDAPRRVGDKIGRLIGARRGEVVVCDSVSVNLYKLLAAALRLRPRRRTILCEAGDFPTDRYIAEGLVDRLGDGYRLRCVAPTRLAAALDRDTAVLLLSHVNYRSGAMHDLAGLTAAAHRSGTLVLWDLSHSAGIVPLRLAAAEVDFAVGCGYKFLNGGPGAPAFAYVARHLQPRLVQPLHGWFGHARPFAFTADYRPAAGIDRLLVGTAPILGLAALESAIDLLLQVPIRQLREKSLRLSTLLIRRIQGELQHYGLSIVTPSHQARRGSQVSLRHRRAWPICQALIAAGVITDFRAPDVLRFGLAPAYLRYVDAWDAITRLRRIMRTEAWRDRQYARRSRVT